MTQECAFPSSDSHRTKYIKYLVFSAAIGIVLTLTGCGSSSPTAATSAGSTAPGDSPATTPGTAGSRGGGDAAACRPFATAWRQYVSEAKSQPDNAGMNLGASISTIVASNPNASVQLITDMTSLHAAVAGETSMAGGTIAQDVQKVAKDCGIALAAPPPA